MREAYKDTFYIRDTKTGAFIPVPAIIGERGPAGGPVWIAYSANADGTDYSETWSSGTDYIGIVISGTEPASKHDYVWCKFKGEPGIQGPQGEPGPQGEKGDPGEDGAPGNSHLSRFSVSANYMVTNPEISSEKLITSQYLDGWFSVKLASRLNSIESRLTALENK